MCQKKALLNLFLLFTVVGCHNPNQFGEKTNKYTHYVQNNTGNPSSTLACTMCMKIAELTTSLLQKFKITDEDTDSRLRFISESVRNVVESDVKTGYCDQLGLFKNICHQLVDNYFSDMYQLMNPTGQGESLTYLDLCLQMKLCDIVGDLGCEHSPDTSMPVYRMKSEL
uniref:Saposin B-type domain-containing protein n=1 Tax=Panagrellus redivivus TaxID=6233 RepID=A0A7E4VC45_PANRE